MFKKIIIAVFVVIMVASISDCFVFAAEQNPKKILACVYRRDDLEFWQSWKSGVQKACEALGLEYVGFSERDEGLQRSLSNTEDAITHGASAITFCASNAAAIIPVSKICEEKGVYIYNIFNNLPWFTPSEAGKHYVCFHTPHYVEVGYACAEALFKAIGGQGNVVEITGRLGTGSSEDLTLGVDLALAKYPGIKLLDRQDGQYTRELSQKIMGDFLVAYPVIDGVITSNDDSALGAIGAYVERGMKIPPIIGSDGIQEAIESIKNGVMAASYVWSPEWAGGYSVVALYDAMNGWEPSVPERMMFISGSIVDKTNVDEYYSKVYESGESIYDWRKMSKVLHPEDWDPQLSIKPIDPNEMWRFFKKPEGYKLPQEMVDAWANGEFTRIKYLYEEHTKSLVF